MADTAIKPEIKVDPSASTPTNLADVEAFEDDTDLQIPPPPTEGGPQAWLVKLPKYVWEAWKEIYDSLPDDDDIDQPITIGQMRVYEKASDDPLKQKIEMRLGSHVPQHQGLPLNYNLNIKTNGYSGTVVFSEKDLPGHPGKPFGSRKSVLARPSGIQPKSERYGQTKPGKYRSVIPKQTALAPMIQHVADAAPVQDESYEKHFAEQYQAAIRPKKTTIISSSIDRGMHPGAANLATFSSFGMSARPGGNKKKVPKEKAVRISQEALLDAIYQCFRRFRYWSLKALRNELKQPEAYIKQTLESIATLVRSGDFAMNYVLRPEYAGMANINPGEVKEETAVVKSESENGSVEGSDGDDDLFEDVEMEGGSGG